MIVSRSQTLLRAATAAALLVLGIGLNGCADMSDSLTVAFADPAKYDLYECKQLETERKNLANRAAELQGLMAKAETGVAGPVVAELAYRNEYVAVRGQARFAEEAWQRNKCRPTPPSAAKPEASSAPAANAKGVPRPVRSGSAVY
jgi:septum formation inhibitor MinC